MSNQLQRVMLTKEVISTELPDQEMVLLHLQSGDYYTLNRTAAQIWQDLQQEPTVAAVGQRLAERYALPMAVAEQHLQQLLRELAAGQLLTLIAAPDKV